MNHKEDPRNVFVHKACIRMLNELDIQSKWNHPYALPFANYVMSWACHLPINTIIIGQNPYPQSIYPEYGAAFAYDTQKCRYPPKTVQVIAADVYNYDNTHKTLSVECFQNSWRLMEAGIILINETVFDKLLPNRSNTNAIKEMEIQVRFLQIVISESYFMGQELFTCIGMGIPAAMMTSIIRSWYPKDLFRMRIMTCKNPAARDTGDMPSHQVTIGKTAVSKVLSSIVHIYHQMAPPKTSAAERRKEQNINALKSARDHVSMTADEYVSELQSFEERLKSARGSPVPEASIDDVLKSLGALRQAVNKHKSSISAHSIALSMLVESLPKASTDSSTTNSIQNSTVVQSQLSTLSSGSRVRRRVTRNPVQSSESIETVPETPEPELPQTRSEFDPPSSITPSRVRRRVHRAPSYAPSNADTEYTTASNTAPLGGLRTKDMSAAESIIMKIFANWCASNIPNDPTYSEILNSSASELSTPNELSKNVLQYIRRRKKEDTQYDAYDELNIEDSATSIWAKESIGF